MKKLLLLASLFFVSTASADEFTAWKRGFFEGAETGYKFCEVEKKAKLSAYEKLLDEVFDTKKLLLAGKIPPPTVVEETVVKKLPDGTSEVERKFKVLPPAYFPLSAIEELKEDLTPKQVVIDRGTAVVVDTSSLPLSKLAYSYYAGEKLGANPVYLPQKHLLVFAVFDRKADAVEFQNKLSSYGVQAQVLEVKEPIRGESRNFEIAEELQKLAEKLKEKEERLLGIKRRSVGLGYLIEKINEAIEVAKALEDNPAYSEFNFVALEKDLTSVKDNVLAYLSDRQPYGRVVLFDPFEEKQKTYQQTVKKLQDENEKLKAEVERLKALVGEKEKLQTDSSIIKKYLRGEL